VPISIHADEQAQQHTITPTGRQHTLRNKHAGIELLIVSSSFNPFGGRYPRCSAENTIVFLQRLDPPVK
jgi:hypothetical protein